jgi:hypothetical protein
MPSRLHTCLACGSELAPCLVRAASLRCHDCRDAKAPLREDLVEGASRLYLLPSVEPGRGAELQRAA